MLSPEVVPAVLPPLLTVREVAEWLRLSKNYVYFLHARGELPSIRIGQNGHSVRFLKDDVEAWLKAHRSL